MKLKNIVDGEKYFVKKSAIEVCRDVKYTNTPAVVVSKGHYCHTVLYTDGEHQLVHSEHLRKLREGEK